MLVNLATTQTAELGEMWLFLLHLLAEIQTWDLLSPKASSDSILLFLQHRKMLLVSIGQTLTCHNPCPKGLSVWDFPGPWCYCKHFNKIVIKRRALK
jgi:hypothetical protein